MPPDGAIRRGDDEGAPNFVFVDVSDPSRAKAAAARRLIHQHAMKDVGKSRRRPKKNATIKLNFVLLEGLEHSQSSPWLGCRWPRFNGLDPFVRFPIELDDTARVLVAYSK